MDFIKKPASLGLGCVTFGREIDQSKSFDLLDYGYASGIRLFDTAAAYSNGKSEEILGNWLLSRGLDRQNIRIDTKILPPFEQGHIRQSVNESLDRLKIDYLDTLYLHRWDETITVEVWLELSALVKLGVVRRIGISNINATNLEKIMRIISVVKNAKPLSAIQNNHNLAVSNLSKVLIEMCLKNNIEIVTFSPLGAGFLTGKHQSGIVNNSRFDIMPAHQAIYFNPQSEARLYKLLKVAKKHRKMPEFLALAWAINQPQTSTVLIGGRTTAQLDVAFEAAKFCKDEVFEELEFT